MGKGGGKGENSKKVAGNARKADAAAAKAAQANAAAESANAAKWEQGAKSSKKADDAAAKKAEAERKKAEKAALLAEEEASLPSKPKASGGAQKKSKNANAKPAAAPARKLDLSQLEDDGGAGSSSSALNASGLDNALDALALTSGAAGGDKIDKHPEKRFKAAYAAFEARRLPEIEEENPGLRRNQRIELCRKEFEKSPENPFNQVSARYDASKDDIANIKANERRKIEERLGG